MKVITYKLHSEIEPQCIYTGLSSIVYGGWIATTCGDPIVSGDDGDDLIESIINGTCSDLELIETREAADEDFEYITETVNSWGLIRSMVNDWLADHAEEAEDITLDGSAYFDAETYGAWIQDCHDSRCFYSLVAAGDGNIDIRYAGSR